ncbi:MAG TPA: molybdenum cofactor guanylyltransferase, partial [Stenotrophomonas sp.]
MHSADGPSLIAGIVLAGGLSSRMGRDKAMLDWRGRPLLAHMRDLLVAAGAGAVRISGDYPAFGGLADRVPRCGPLGGLHTAVESLPDGPAWVVPVDMPRLDIALLHALRDAPHAACVTFMGEPLPMRLNIDTGCRKLLSQMIFDPAGLRSLRAL